jgi:hypothetical protein
LVFPEPSRSAVDLDYGVKLHARAAGQCHLGKCREEAAVRDVVDGIHDSLLD